MANDSGRRDRPSGRPGNANAGGNAGFNNNVGGFGGEALWVQDSRDQIRDILHVLFKRKRIVALLFVVVALPGLISAFLKPPSYQAVAKVMISSDRTNPTVQPTEADQLETIKLNESLVNSEVQVLTSRNLMENVVQELAGPVPVGVSAKVQPASSFAFGQQILALGRSLQVTPVKASNVIQVAYSSADPMNATRIVNRVIDAYLSYHADVHSQKGLPRFYDEQLRNLEQQARKASDALADFTAREGIVSPKDEVYAAVQQVNQASALMRDSAAKVATLEEQIRVVREQISLQPEVVKRSQSVSVNPVITQLSAQLVDREVDRIALLRKYTEKDRHLRDNSEEIAELRTRLETASREQPTIVSNQLFRSNPVRDERLRSLLDLERDLHGERARQAALEDDVSRVRRRLVALRQKGIEYDRLDKEVRSHYENYDLFSKRLFEARLAQAMDEEHFVNVDVIQRPALPLPRTDSTRSSAVLSLVAGLVVGVAGAFAREFVGRSVRSEQDVSRNLGLPLLATISDVPKV